MKGSGEKGTRIIEEQCVDAMEKCEEAKTVGLRSISTTRIRLGLCILAAKRVRGQGNWDCRSATTDGL